MDTQRETAVHLDASRRQPERRAVPRLAPDAGPEPGSDARFNWIVALDARGDCRGALELVKWLAERSDRHRFFGVHVPSEDDAAASESEDRARAVVESAQAGELVEVIVRTRTASAPEDILSEVDPDVAAGLVVSRRADAEGASLLRLGGTVRRLAEQTSTPVAIAPHDLERTQISRGPVLVAVDPEHTPSDVGIFSQHLASSKGLDLMLVNVAHVDDAGLLSASVDALHDAYRRAEREAATELERWAIRHGLASSWRTVVRGDVRFAIQTVAQRHDASVIVCGTRQRNIFSRLIEPSRALEIARYARRPVFLVPRARDEDAEVDPTPLSWAAAVR